MDDNPRQDPTQKHWPSLTTIFSYTAWTKHPENSTICFAKEVQKFEHLATLIVYFTYICVSAGGQIPIFMNLVCYNSQKNDNETGNSAELNSVFAFFTQKL